MRHQVSSLCAFKKVVYSKWSLSLRAMCSIHSQSHLFQVWGGATCDVIRELNKAALYTDKDVVEEHSHMEYYLRAHQHEWR